MNYLQIDSINNIDVKLFVRDILNKSMIEDDHNLCSLYSCVPTPDDTMIFILVFNFYCIKSF
jgi:hypothetical protein